MGQEFDSIVIGAGAAGLFFAWEAGKRGKRVLLIDHAKKIGEKIRISGGGRCNFTNIHTAPANFLSQNPKFCISALRGFTPQDFIDRVERAGIAYHEKKLGQLFCDGSAQEMIDMLTGGVRETGGTLISETAVEGVHRSGERFLVRTADAEHSAPTLIVATGGKSIPKIGASGFGYQLAEEFELEVIEPRPGLVPLTFEGSLKEMAKELSGLSVEASIGADPQAGGGRKKAKPTRFQEGMLFTHRGLSGPSILQISNYWTEGGDIVVDLGGGRDLFAALRERRSHAGKAAFTTALAELLPKRLAGALAGQHGWSGNLADWSDKKLRAAADLLESWRVRPSGSEGYRTAEVTLGGVDTDGLNSRTMEARSVRGLFFIGEVVDVTGWLGGYNFQWAWASAYAAARAV